ncbi:relaxase/mobilization nuclease domain-containing protein [uncultured Campylobacter sp.]|uniref:relaxase/mobilization nuclease domain-containing protein n=2 Tax=Campylobacter TaxID=194 RepID=UPI002625C165|nr:relaxase/mobilization nuclease domain-containing protein [uncultured Campylobacter sp.]
MIVKFLPTKNGGGLGSVNYLLNERQEQGTARVLKGSEAQVRALIAQMPYKQKTCFGVLSFSEQANSISDEIKQDIIKDLERALLGDYMKDRVAVLWVEHSDKHGRLELNFLIPKIDLITGKSFNPYFAKRDQFNIDLWKRTINDEYGFTSPNNPTKQQNIRIDKKDLAHYDTVAQLDKTLKELVAQGAIKSRAHMIELLGASDYKVTRQNESGISIVLPNQKRPNRMRGGIYDGRFTDIDKLSELGESESKRIRKYVDRDTQEECRYNRERISENIRRRDQRNKKRYKEATLGDRLRNEADQRNDIKRDEARYNTKIIKWYDGNNLGYRVDSRIFNQLFYLRQTHNGLPNAKLEATSEQSRVAEVADSGEFKIRGNRQQNKPRLSLHDFTQIDAQSNGRDETLSNLQREIIDDETADRIVRRSREIARRNSEIAERERRVGTEIRKTAESKSSALLRGLSEQIRTRVREYLIGAQERIKPKREQIRKLRERTDANRSYQEQIKSALDEWRKRLLGDGILGIIKQIRELANKLRIVRKRINGHKDDIEREFGGYENRIKHNIRQANERYGAAFRECLESETKRASSACGSEIERELKKPERQKLVELKRQKELSLARTR